MVHSKGVRGATVENAPVPDPPHASQPVEAVGQPMLFEAKTPPPHDAVSATLREGVCR